MGIIKCYVCDTCGNRIERNEKYLIYGIKFWNKKYGGIQGINFLGVDSPTEEAAMFCSPECLGEYICNLLNNKNKTYRIGK